MTNDSLQPFILLGVAISFSVAASLYATSASHKLHGLTFEQRWAPVELMDEGWKWRQVPLKPLPELPSAKGDRLNANHYNGPYRIYGGSRIVSACPSFCEFP